ncbi:unnamed protein product, partial [Mesorhabditis belari]|uniref:Mos1 transposase HTH domain-containing protein n=1 Tax=Mesorhabditis belari TaxID=2138241 RepID=A0AAF3EPN1_9BILA
MVEQKFVLRAALLFNFKIGKSAAESHRSLCATFGDGSLSLRQCQTWFQRFREGDETLEDYEHGSRPEVVNEATLRDVIQADPCQSARDLAKIFHCDHVTVERHLFFEFTVKSAVSSAPP